MYIMSTQSCIIQSRPFFKRNLPLGGLRPLANPRRSLWILIAVAAVIFANVPGRALAAADAETIAADRNGDPAMLALIGGSAREAVIRLPEKPAPAENLAARELAEHLKAITGVALPVTSGPQPASAIPIRIGKAAPAALVEAIPDPAVEAAFAYRVTPDGIDFRGATPEGTANAVYHFLESLGVRWFMPGEIGRVVPEADTLEIPLGLTVETPDFRHREFQHVSRRLPWWKRNGLSHEQWRRGAHGFPGIPNPRHPNRRKLFREHPEWFALIDGKRVNKQMDLSNEALFEHVVAATKRFWEKNPDRDRIGIGPDDGYGYSQDPGSLAMDSGRTHPWNGQPSYTDRYIRFINRVIEAVEPEYPGKQYHFYVYQSHILPPTVEPHPAIVGITAPINFDRIHGIDNPRSLDRAGYAKIMEEWAEQLPLMAERGYYFNLADPGLPFSKIHTLEALMRTTKELGFIAHTPETKATWPSNGPTLYVAAKMYWDAEADPYAILEDYAERFFGPAAEPMHRYLLEVDEAWRTVDTMAGGSFAVPHAFPPERVAKMREWLEQAASSVPEESVFAERIGLFALNFQALEGFLEMWDGRNRTDFDQALAGYEAAAAAIKAQATSFLIDREELAGTDLTKRQKTQLVRRSVVMNGTGPDRYLQRFWQRMVREGHDRTVARGKKWLQLPDTWDFLFDPTDAGRWGAWYRDGAMRGNWRAMDTYSRTWSSQGLHYYKGVAWYRTQFNLPEMPAERPLYLWFSGVDERAEVWLNGQSLGTTTEPALGLPGIPRAFRPVDFDITDIVRTDGPNTLAVRVVNQKQNEVGTGGIVGPVMIWSPLDAADDPVRPAE